MEKLVDQKLGKDTNLMQAVLRSMMGKAFISPVQWQQGLTLFDRQGIHDDNITTRGHQVSFVKTLGIGAKAELRP